MAGSCAHGTHGVTNEVNVGSREFAKWSVWDMPATSVASVYQIFRDILPDDSLVRIEKVTRSVVRLSRHHRTNDRPTVVFEITTSAPRKNTLPHDTLYSLGEIYSAKRGKHNLKAWLDTLYPINGLYGNRRPAQTHLHTNDLPAHFYWRIKPHRPHRIRHTMRTRRRQQNDTRIYEPKMATPRIISWNIRTATNNRPVLAHMLEKHRPQILAAQEHLIKAQTFPLRMRGYHTIHRSLCQSTPGARGICILYNQDLPVIELPCNNPNILPLHISGLLKNTDCIFINVYIPVDSATTDHRRNICIQEFIQLLNKYHHRHPHIPIIAAGDFNMRFGELYSKLPGTFDVVQNLLPTRFSSNADQTPSTIDFFVISENARPYTEPRAAIRAGYDISDHVPLVLTLRNTVSPPTAKFSRTKVDTAKMRAKAPEIRSDNRWDVLAELENEEDYADLFLNTSQAILADNACLPQSHHQPSKRSFYTFSTATKRAIQKSKRLTKAVRFAQIMGRDVPTAQQNRAQAAQEHAKQLRMKDGRKGWTKHLHKGWKPLVEHNYKLAWKWIRSFTTSQQQKSLPTIPPTRDRDGNMLSDLESIMDATREHYGALATDPEAQPVEWWERHCPMDTAEPIEELNADLTWPELNATLHQLKSGTCPGMDHIPNEFFRLVSTAHDVTESTQPMGQALLKACNAVFSGFFSETLNTSLLISLPKPGKDFTFLDNRRGISLISCLMKLVTKVIANRLQAHVINTATGLRKEQAGFRLSEECNAQVATLKEIAGRRANENKPTYVAFIDLQKAFDMIPHNGMLHVLRAKGISGKCLHFIRRLYERGLFRILVGPSVSQELPLERGVRQGDSLSPLLFNLVMNSCLDTIDGVTVPGLNQQVPGLLLADDAAIFAENHVQMATNLRKLGEWASKWKMKIGHSKCGLMVLHNPRAHETAKTRDWIIQDNPIPVVDSYKYLGVSIDTSVSSETMAAARAATGKKTLGALSPFLANPSIPLHMKKLVIKVILIPQICYGAEVWASNLKHIQWGQTVLDNAIRLCLMGSSKNKRAVSILCALNELDIPNINAVARARLARAWIKWRHQRTWIADLTQHRSTSKLTWTQQSNKIFNELQRKTGVQVDLASDNIDERAIAKQIQTHLQRTYTSRAKAEAAGGYLQYNMANTSRYIPTAIKQKAKTPLRRLVRTRLNAWPGLLYRMKHWLDICQTDGFTPRCASCHQVDIEDTLYHLHMECPAFQAQRERLLEPVMAAIRGFCTSNNVDELNLEDMWHACLGGLRANDETIVSNFSIFWINKQATASPADGDTEPEGGRDPHVPQQQNSRAHHRYELRSLGNTNNNTRQTQLAPAEERNHWDSPSASSGMDSESSEHLQQSESDGDETAAPNPDTPPYVPWNSLFYDETEDHHWDSPSVAARIAAGISAQQQLLDGDSEEQATPEDDTYSDMESDPRAAFLLAETESSTARPGEDADLESDSTSSPSAPQTDSPVDPTTPLWQRVAQYVDQVLSQHFSNIKSFLRSLGSPTQPGRPRTNAPFRVRQHFESGTSARRLPVVHQHIIDATVYVQGIGQSPSAPTFRAHSSRQGVG